MTYEQAVSYIHSLGELGWKPGLARMTALCERLGNPQKRLKCIHIAGTNGKGSTTTMVSSILRHAGYRVDGYFSPYLYDIRERVQINGEMIDKESFARLVETLKGICEEMAETEHGHPTEFEVKTALGFLYFVEQGVDFAVLEVGLGGRLDATNVVKPLVCAITNVTMDHMIHLGNTLPEIAGEKAGIIKPGVPVITAAQEPEALAVIRRNALDKRAPLWRVVPIENGFEIERPTSDIRLPTFKLRMAGDFQELNAATAFGIVQALVEKGFTIHDADIHEGLENAYIPGRLEILRERPTLLIDGAHNIDAARNLAQSLKKDFRYDRLILVMGMVSGHIIEDVLAVLAPLADRFIATSPDNERAAPASAISEAARIHCPEVTEITPVAEAVRIALSEASENDLVCVTGSFYTIGEVPRDRGQGSGDRAT